MVFVVYSYEIKNHKNEIFLIDYSIEEQKPSIMLLITLISILILNTEGLDGTLSEWIDLQCEVSRLNMTNL